MYANEMCWNLTYSYNAYCSFILCANTLTKWLNRVSLFWWVVSTPVIYTAWLWLLILTSWMVYCLNKSWCSCRPLVCSSSLLHFPPISCISCLIVMYVPLVFCSVLSSSRCPPRADSRRAATYRTEWSVRTARHVAAARPDARPASRLYARLQGSHAQRGRRRRHALQDQHRAQLVALRFPPLIWRYLQIRWAHRLLNLN